MGYLRLTASLAATTAIALAGVEVAADLQARSELARIVAAQPGLTIGAIRVEPFGGRLVIDGIEAGRGPGAHVAIGRLTLARPPLGLGFVTGGFVTSARAESALDRAIKALPNPQPQAAPPDEAAPPANAGAGAEATPSAPSGAAVPGTATAENVVVTSGTTTWRIKRIDLTGTTLSNADLAKLLDANSGESAEARLRKLNATSIAVPEIVLDDPTAGSEGHAVLSQIKLSGVVAGRATAVSVAGATFQSKTGEETTDGTVGATQAFGVDFAQLAHVAGTVRTDDTEPVLPLCDSVTVNTVKASNGKGGTFSLASFKETGAKARPLKTDIFAARKPRETRSKAEEAALFADMTHSFEIASMAVVDVAGRNEDPKEPGGFALASFGLRGFGTGKVGGLSLRGLRVEASTVKLGLGSAEIGAFHLPQGNLDAVGSANTMAVSAGKADFDKIDVDVASKDKADQRVKFAIGHGSLASEGVAGDIPAKFRLAIDNVTFDVPGDPGQAKPLVEMGYRHLDLSAGLAATYDAARQELAIRDLTLKGADMGSVGLGLHLLNVTKGVISSEREVQKASLLAVLARELTVDVANDGLVDRAIAWKAKQDGIGVDDEKASIIEFFDKTLPAQVNSANVKIVGTAIAKFVAAPKKLHIGILSRSGFGAGSMALLSDPGLLIDSLEVNASAN